MTLPLWLTRLLGPDPELTRLRDAATRYALRQEQDSHPVTRTDWEPYRRVRSSRLRRPYVVEYRTDK